MKRSISEIRAVVESMLNPKYAVIKAKYIDKNTYEYTIKGMSFKSKAKFVYFNPSDLDLTIRIGLTNHSLL